jgi:hypothetical protein
VAVSKALYSWRITNRAPAILSERVHPPREGEHLQVNWTRFIVENAERTKSRADSTQRETALASTALRLCVDGFWASLRRLAEAAPG